MRRNEDGILFYLICSPAQLLGQIIICKQIKKQFYLQPKYYVERVAYRQACVDAVKTFLCATTVLSVACMHA